MFNSRLFLVTIVFSCVVLECKFWHKLLEISQASIGYLNCFTWVLYMSSSFWLLRVESRDFSQAEKERIARKAVQIHKMMTIFTQNVLGLSFWVKIVVILWICTALQAVLSFSAHSGIYPISSYSCRGNYSFLEL